MECTPLFFCLGDGLPLAKDATPLLLGKADTDTPAQPLAWYRTYGPKQARVFYTSLGAPEDVKQPDVVRLYNNCKQRSENVAPAG